MKSNLILWIEEASDGHPIEGVVIGKLALGSQTSKQDRNVVLSWEKAKPSINYDFDSSFGSVGCNPITAWTDHRVIFVSQYDGSTRIEFVPRHPIDHIPTMPGG